MFQSEPAVVCRCALRSIFCLLCLRLAPRVADRFDTLAQTEREAARVRNRREAIRRCIRSREADQPRSLRTFLLD
jgi:hypothetical protein